MENYLNKEQLQTKLNGFGIKPNRYRVDILDFLQSNKQHPTAEDVFDFLKSRYPFISFATVYNNLNLFLDNKLVQRINTDGNKARFDFDTDEHHHFICKHCERVFDIPKTSISINAPTKTEEGYTIESHTVYAYGQCGREDCSIND